MTIRPYYTIKWRKEVSGEYVSKDNNYATAKDDGQWVWYYRTPTELKRVDSNRYRTRTDCEKEIRQHYYEVSDEQELWSQ